jgi:hypothetical protein
MQRATKPCSPRAVVPAVARRIARSLMTQIVVQIMHKAVTPSRERVNASLHVLEKRIVWVGTAEPGGKKKSVFVYDILHAINRFLGYSWDVPHV